MLRSSPTEPHLRPLTLPGIPPPPSEIAAQVHASVYLTPDGIVHHLEFEVRSITGALLAAESAPAAVADSPGRAAQWCADRLAHALNEALEPFPDE